MSAARHAYGLPDPANEEQPRRRAGFVPLLVLVLGLAAASIWFVALPALDEPARVERTCEVIVLETGITRCVEKPAARGKTTTNERAAEPARP